MIKNQVKHNLQQEQAKIGRLIEELRTEKGLTQKDFAQALGTSQSAVARMEKGEQNFSSQMLAKIGVVLKKDIITLSDKTVNLKIEGGHKLHGTITVNASKNAAVSLLCASLLNKGRTHLKNVPKIEEVYRIVEVLESIGVAVKWVNNNELVLAVGKVNINNLDREAALKTRSAVLLLGPLIHLLKTFKLPHPGGCKLGRRTVKPHLYALEKLGVKILTTHDDYKIKVGPFNPAEIIMYESGDTATENAIMAASRIVGKTTIKLASANYMVQDLCHFLSLLGVRISGIGSTTLTIEGLREINKNVMFTLSEDPIEAMLFLSLAATTNSGITIERCLIDFLELELLKLSKMGFKYKILKRYKSYNNFTNLVDIKTFPSKLVALEEKIEARPFPGLNIDNLPFFVPVATQAAGTTLIHDWVYENRAIYYMELTKLRANLILADPHRVYIEGPTPLRAADITCPPALRPAAIILIAMLAAKGTSTLRHIYSLSRGYEDLANRLKKLGARINIIHEW